MVQGKRRWSRRWEDMEVSWEGDREKGGKSGGIHR